MIRTGHASELSPNGALPRRRFLGLLATFGGTLVGAALSVPLLRFVLYPVLRTTSDMAWSEVGSLEEFTSLKEPLLKTIQIVQRDGWRKLISEKAVYVVAKGDGKIRVLSPVCPHLGCLIGWHADKKIFVSPCHGGIFSPDGGLVAGPPRRAMDELESRVEKGKLLVKYQYFKPLIARKESLG